MSEIMPYLAIAALVLLIIFLTLYLIAKGKLEALKPYVNDVMIEIEASFKDSNVKKAGVAKMIYVVTKVREVLPTWVNKILTNKLIEEFCQASYDLIADKLDKEVEEYRKKYLENNKVGG